MTKVAECHGGQPLSHDCTFDSLRSMVDAMDIPSPFTIESLSDRIATSRGRPLYLHPMAFPADAATSGALVSTTDADHVFYERHTSTFHQNHIVLHELGHLLAGHPGVNAPATVPASLLPDLDHDFVRRYLQRSCLHDSA